ncbi:MAG: amidohydrolase family protein, partial [Halobacteria archaeon]|nr:amidohydrolase family protein [Halobacteria archaeon]
MREEVRKVTLGDEDADLVLRGGTVVSTPDRQTREVDVAVKNRRVASLRDDATDVTGDETEVIDVSGKYVSPGFIDVHTHLDLHQNVEKSYHRALEGGTTAAVSEVAALGPTFGSEGVEEFLKATS